MRGRNMRTAAKPGRAARALETKNRQAARAAGRFFRFDSAALSSFHNLFPFVSSFRIRTNISYAQKNYNIVVDIIIMIC